MKDCLPWSLYTVHSKEWQTCRHIWWSYVPIRCVFRLSAIRLTVFWRMFDSTELDRSRKWLDLVGQHRTGQQTMSAIKSVGFNQPTLVHTWQKESNAKLANWGSVRSEGHSGSASTFALASLQIDMAERRMRMARNDFVVLANRRRSIG